MQATRSNSISELLGAPDPPCTGRERLVAAAIELFYRHGFGDVGLDQIIAAAGVTKSTFYKHFESKDEIMVAAVERRDEWESQAWARAMQKLAGDDPAGQLLALFDILDIWFNDPDYHGCMFMNAAAEFPNPHAPVHQAAMAHRRRTRDYFRDLARRAGASESSAETFADCYTVLVEGTLIFRHTHRRDDAARTVRPAAEQMLKFLPAAVEKNCA